VRLEVDRELAVRRELRGLAEHGRTHPAASDNRGPAGEPPRHESESIVMRDAREVEAGRKRYLGAGRD
jgi:hypothetical protein